MKVSDFVKNVSNKYGPDKLEGAMLMLNIDRLLDNIIRWAFSLDGFHRGQPGLWSHCVLIAAPFNGDSTPILDCTIRDSKNRVIWNPTLLDDIDSIFGGNAGGIYSGKISDYDSENVKDCGVYFLPHISKDKRHQIVLEGQRLQGQGYHYDLPGLVRELIRLLLGKTYSGNNKLLFCSAFLAMAYREALGLAWTVAPSVPTDDITEDDIWYSKTGITVPPAP